MFCIIIGPAKLLGDAVARSTQTFGALAMDDLKFAQLDDQRGWSRRLKIWLPRLVVASLFFFVGVSKLGGQSRWIATFEQIGFGQWFRYATGVFQLAGALMVLVPRLFLFGITMLASTMLGAMAVWAFILGAPSNAIFPGALLVGLIVVAAEDFVNLFQPATSDGRLNSTDGTEQIVAREPS